MGESDCVPTEQAIRRVMSAVPRFSREQALSYIATAHRGRLICLDCGSENHTRGHTLCLHIKLDG